MGYCTWRPGAVHATRRAAQRPQRVGGSARHGLGGCHPGSLWGHPRSAACVTRRMLGCRTDPIVKTIEHFWGGIPACSVRCSTRVAIPRAPAPARRAHAGRGTRRVRPRASSAVSHKRRWVDDGVTPGRPSSQSRATILSVPVFATTWGLLAARPPPPDTRWPLGRGARCGASLR